MIRWLRDRLLRQQPFHRDQAINNLLIVKQGSKLNAVVFSRSAAAIRDAIEADRKSRQIRLPGT